MANVCEMVFFVIWCHYLMLVTLTEIFLNLPHTLEVSLNLVHNPVGGVMDRETCHYHCLNIIKVKEVGNATPSLSPSYKIKSLFWLRSYKSQLTLPCPLKILGGSEMLVIYSFVECPVSFKENVMASLLSADIFSIFIARNKKKEENIVQGHFIITL